ncbi:methylated-DNA--[protein]-cysteine S-methyltransferase [Frigoribacterium faeni]|uniref:Methylated-DNA--protein-cysteine methyltransferase n=2 Tax=Frigoribacterium faeni TaxID=145483 RepID=A0A7W3JFV3_9MICO|nr:methylated-DNA-[protein]-cysteine S-methyltransferase [Frigoribacterium faeni]
MTIEQDEQTTTPASTSASASASASAVMVHTVVPTPVGDLTLVGSDGGLTGVYFTEHRHLPDPTGFGSRSRSGVGATDFAAVEQQLGEYFAGERRAFDLPLAPVGNDFRLRVWALLREIPYGETRSYGRLAGALGDVRLARAVGAANGLNPLSIVVPCHRVVGAGGSLVGYAGGLERKRFLLGLEAEQPSGPETGRLF